MIQLASVIEANSLRHIRYPLNSTKSLTQHLFHSGRTLLYKEKNVQVREGKSESETSPFEVDEKRAIQCISVALSSGRASEVFLEQ